MNNLHSLWIFHLSRYCQECGSVPLRLDEFNCCPEHSVTVVASIIHLPRDYWPPLSSGNGRTNRANSDTTVDAWNTKWQLRSSRHIWITAALHVVRRYYVILILNILANSHKMVTERQERTCNWSGLPVVHQTTNTFDPAAPTSSEQHWSEVGLAYVVRTGRCDWQAKGVFW